MEKKLIVNKIKVCRSCGSDSLIPIISLGSQYISNFITADEKLEDYLRAPLDLVLCNEELGGCGLVQLHHTVSRELLYNKYWFKSGLNEIMIEALRNIVEKAEQLINLDEKDIVLDIGCNDGTLLRSYRTKCILIGFEPASNLVNEARKGTTQIINDFFSFKTFNKYFPKCKCKIITTIAMFYDLDDPNSFVKDIVNCLDKNGIWVIQMAYLGAMLEQNAFDNIGHEHLEYYSLKPLKTLLEKHNLDIFDVEFNEVYGGSIRVYVKHKSDNSKEISNYVRNIEHKETEIGLLERKTYESFANRIITLRRELCDFINTEIKRGKIIYAYGASTKGNTILQFCNLDSTLVKNAVDRDPMKLGKLTIGTHILIISEEQARKEKPDYFLILPWHLIKFFMKREREFLDAGGKFIVPLPLFQILDKNSKL